MRSPLSASFEGYSLALYSSWLYCRPFHFAVDCGEGLATSLRNRAFGIRVLALTHGHLDHISGLPSLINARETGMGGHDQPLLIVHPAGDPFLAPMRRYIEASQPSLRVPLSWQPMEPGQRVPLDEQRSLEAFATVHAGFLTLGYRLLEHRTRLRPAWRGRSAAEIREAAAQGGRQAVNEPYDHPLAVFGGDGLTPSAELLAGASTAFLEATFLRREDRGPLVHASMDEAVRAAAEAGVADLVLSHVSGRYERAEARARALELAAEAGFGGRLHLHWRGSLELLDGPGLTAAQPQP